MEDLPLGRIADLVPEFAVKDLSLGRTHDDDDDDDRPLRNSKFYIFVTFGSSPRTAATSLVFPFWGPKFESRCSQEDNCSGQCRDFLEFFSVFSHFPFSSPTFFTFNPSPVHVISYSNS